uniref:Uncharacterized protein n=1 Tax=viral metagenome TaxID=1070528 RepID=A0A6C0LP36_9ZZZZ
MYQSSHNSSAVKSPIIEKLNKYVFNKQNIDNINNNIFFDKPKNGPCLNKPAVIEIKKKLTLFLPQNANDSLFWCFYIMKNGIISYEMMPHKNVIGEKKIKFEYVESLVRKNKDFIKKYKFTTISNIENVLANENKLDLGTFITLCALENLNIIFVNKKTYFELTTNESDIKYIVRNVNGIYGFETGEAADIEKIKSESIKIDNICKPLKSISSYKVNELIEMNNKLGLDIKHGNNDKNKTKNDLYEQLFKYF